MSDVSTRVKNVISGQLDVKPDEISTDKSFIKDFGLDSLDIVELVMAFEEEFGIEIPEKVAEKIFTVADVIKYVEEVVEAEA